mmetsp:Transcript_15231/g.38657  ORF Transcript_15231/g.38657 Transcript_15231/m.38657 type:complete len:356 (+) Transcript_15231:286-1353(+)
MIEVETKASSAPPAQVADVEYRAKECDTARGEQRGELAPNEAEATTTIANEAELLCFSGRDILAAEQESKKFFGVLAEIATRGVLRYKWERVKPLVACLVEARLEEYKGRAMVEFGPNPAQGGLDAHLARLNDLLDSFRAYPFTMQRICEILVLPSEYYSTFVQLVWALEKCFMVTATVGPSPKDSLGDALPTIGELEREIGAMQRPQREGPSPQEQQKGTTPRAETEGEQQGQEETLTQGGAPEEGSSAAAAGQRGPPSRENAAPGSNGKSESAAAAAVGPRDEAGIFLAVTGSPTSSVYNSSPANASEFTHEEETEVERIVNMQDTVPYSATSVQPLQETLVESPQKKPKFNR